MKSEVGICNICKQEFSKRGILRHLKVCKSRDEFFDENLCKETNEYKLLKIDLKHNKDIWMYVYIKSELFLSNLDCFLRESWFEQNDQLSTFTIDKVISENISNIKIADSMNIDSKIVYEYNLGNKNYVDIKVCQDLVELHSKDDQIIAGQSHETPKNSNEDDQNKVESESKVEVEESEVVEDAETSWSKDLNTYRKEDIEKVAQILEIEINDKKELIDLIIEKCKNEFTSYFNYMGTRAIEVYQKLVEHKGELDLTKIDLFEIKETGNENIVFNSKLLKNGCFLQIYTSTSENESVGFIPEELYEILKEVDFREYDQTAKRNTAIANRAQNLIEIYGIVDISIIAKCLKNQGLKVDENELKIILQWASVTGFDMVAFEDRYFAFNETINANDYTNNEIYKTIDYKLFSKEVKTSKLCTKHSRNIKEVKHFENYLKKTYNMAKKELDRTIDELIVYRRVSCEDVEMMFEDILGDNNIDEKEKEILKEKYIDMMLNLPVWRLKGNSIIECDEKYKTKLNKYANISYKTNIETETPIITKKVGRNDPCPCNSGKKFKKCCGK